MDISLIEDALAVTGSPCCARILVDEPRHTTVGEFCKYLRSGFAQLADHLGEARLFCGGSRHQLRGKELNASNLIIVTDLGSAQAAIDFIVEQGVGSAGNHES